MNNVYGAKFGAKNMGMSTEDLVNSIFELGVNRAASGKWTLSGDKVALPR